MSAFTDEQAQAIASLEQAFPEVKLVVIGAVGLGCHLPNQWRRTNDLDLTLAVDFDRFGVLERSNEWARDPELPYRFTHRNGLRVDLLPSAKRYLDEGSITFAQTGQVTRGGRVSRAVRVRKLPSLAIIDPDFMGDGQNDDHPPANIQKGQAFVKRVVDRLMSNPEVWKKTVLFITYDEHGGLYDHMPPPPACVPDDLKPAQFAFDKYGVRVPLLIVSPFTKPGYVSHTIADHTSLRRAGVELTQCARRAHANWHPACWRHRMIAKKLTVLVAGLFVSVGACHHNEKPAEGPAETTGKKVDNAAQETKEAAKDTKEETKETAKEAKEETKEAAKDAKDATKETASDAKKNVKKKTD